MFSLPGLKTFKAPSSEGTSALHDPVEEDDGDAFDYDAPSKFEKLLPWLLVLLAYLLTVGGGVGSYFYLESQAGAIEQEMIDRRPSNLIEQIKISKATDNSDKSGVEGEATSAPSTPTGSSEDTSASPSDGSQESQSDAESQSASNEGEARDQSPDQSTGETDEAAAVDFVEMAPNPAPGLVEESPDGPLPKIANDGRAPWQVYARPHDALDDRPKIAIVMVGLGVSTKATEAALEQLPGAITFAFSPYAAELPGWIDKARDAGHEVMLTLPLEPEDFPKSDPGPYALYTSLEPAQNARKLNWILSRATGYVGLISYQGSKYLSSKPHTRRLAAELKARGLLYMDSFYSPVNASPEMMELIDVPYVSMDQIIDVPPGRADVSQKLKNMEALADQKGVAVAIAHPYSATIKQIQRWAEELDEKGLALIPVTAVEIEALQK